MWVDYSGSHWGGDSSICLAESKDGWGGQASILLLRIHGVQLRRGQAQWGIPRTPERIPTRAHKSVSKAIGTAYLKYNPPLLTSHSSTSSPPPQFQEKERQQLMWRRRGGVVAASTCSLVKKGSLAQERLSGWSAFSTSASNYSWRTSRTFAFSQIGRRSSIDHNLPLLIGVGAALCTSMMSTTRRIWCDEEAVTTQSLSAKLKQYSNVMFPVYKVRYYWSQTSADLISFQSRSDVVSKKKKCCLDLTYCRNIGWIISIVIL